MIITAFPRSAGTIHCIKEAEAAGLRFADEPFQWSISSNVRTGIPMKPTIHEAYLAGNLSTDVNPEYVRSHLDEFVVLNHNPAKALLDSTEVFLIRQDLTQMAESWIHLFGKIGQTRDESLSLFLEVGLFNIRNICSYLLSKKSKVLKCETLYSFTPRRSSLKFKLQPLVDEVYNTYV